MIPISKDWKSELREEFNPLGEDIASLPPAIIERVYSPIFCSEATPPMCGKNVKSVNSFIF
jgi:hypothetical protein